jgi:hypothetical protein
MRTIFNLSVISLVLLGLVASGALAQTQETERYRLFEENQIIGQEVAAQDGEDFGEITALLYDGSGRIAFAVVSAGGFLGMGGKKVAVPFTAMSFDPEGKHYVVNLSRASLENAPTYSDEWLENPDIVAGVYRYFGIQPYWEGSQKSSGAADPGATSGPGRTEPETGSPQS